jgi:two-component system CheB/CheR fusion protein
LTREPHPLEIKGVHWRHDGHEHTFDVRLAPLLGDGVILGTSITYTDVTASEDLQSQLTASKRDLEQAYEELQSTVEELETTNEELQSTNEELETTNEELQSTNEELETMNEELQSSNEELETMNDELRHRSTELNDINAFLETILATIGMAVAVVDRRQHVQIWNGQARELWGVTADEAEDQHLFSLDIGLPLEQLKPMLRSVMTNSSEREETTVEATNRRGRAFQCRVTALSLGSAQSADGSGAIVLMEPIDA